MKPRLNKRAVTVQDKLHKPFWMTLNHKEVYECLSLAYRFGDRDSDFILWAEDRIKYFKTLELIGGG